MGLSLQCGKLSYIYIRICVSKTTYVFVSNVPYRLFISAPYSENQGQPAD